MRYGPATAIVTALLFAAATAAPALAQSGGAPIPGNAPPREMSPNTTNNPQSMKDKPTTSGGMSASEATGGRVGTPQATGERMQPDQQMGTGSRALGKSKNAKGGASMERVKAAQNALNRAGANIQVDGKMGPKTKAAIRDYQQKNGLQATGNLDAQTMQRLGVS